MIRLLIVVLGIVLTSGQSNAQFVFASNTVESKGKAVQVKSPSKASAWRFENGECFTCTTCGNNCECFGEGHYCSNGKCPIGLKKETVLIDGISYEKGSDGFFRKVENTAQVVAVQNPFAVSSPGVIMPGTTVQTVVQPNTTFPGVGQGTGRTTTNVLSVGQFGITSGGCANGNCSASNSGTRFGRR